MSENQSLMNLLPRKHILKKHSRADNQNFVCARCSKGFETKKILQEHLKAPVEFMCDPADPDPEDGIDSTTAKRIIDRRRKSSGSTEQDQWNDLWLLVFPDDSIIPSFGKQTILECLLLASLPFRSRSSQLTTDSSAHPQSSKPSSSTTS